MKVLFAISILFFAIAVYMLTTSAIHANKLFKKDYNCADFKTQREAQKMFEKDSKDIYRLDGDKDGVACESLPK